MAQAENLAGIGYDCLTALDGESAVEAALGNREIALVLMDIDLGRGIDGTEAARRILAERDVPIVFLTSHAEREMVDKVRGITRYGYVIKDSGDFVLQSSIEMALELFEAHDKLRREERSLRALVQTIPDLIWMKNADGVYLRCNWMFERFFGAPERDIVGKTDFDFVSPELAAFFRERDRIAMEAGKSTRNEEWITFAADGRRALLETVKSPIMDERGTVTAILGVGRDITERRRSEELLEKGRETGAAGLPPHAAATALAYPPEDAGGPRLKDIFDAPLLERIMEEFYALTGMNIGITDTEGALLVSVGNQDICARFHRANPATRAFCLKTNAELTDGVAPGEVREYRCPNGMRDVSTPIHIGGKHVGNIKTGQFFYEDEEVDQEDFRRRAGSYGFDQGAYLEALAKVPRFSRERVQATMRFYSELAGLVGGLGHRNLQLARVLNERETLLSAVNESEERFRAIANYTMDWESWFAPDGRILWINPGAEKVTGYSSDELLAMPSLIGTLVPEENRAAVERVFAQALTGGSGENYEYPFIHKDGRRRWLSVSWQPIADRDGNYAGLRTSGRDVTDRREDEEKLARSVEEKEVLLRELKHRVKNSLALVSSLLSLNRELIADERDLRLFSEAVDRIKSVSAIYDQLNVSEGIDRISIDTYIRSLVRMLREGYTTGSEIRFVEEVAGLSIPMKTAVPLGLIVNELVTNAIKYAYPPGTSGEVRIELEGEDWRGELRVVDYGQGLPPGFDPERTESLGVRIAGMLARQIGGKLAYGEGPGTAATVSFRF